MSWLDPSLCFSLKKKVPTDVLVKPKPLFFPQEESPYRRLGQTQAFVFSSRRKSYRCLGQTQAFVFPSGRKSLLMSRSDPSLCFSLTKKVPTDVLVRPKFLFFPQEESPYRCLGQTQAFVFPSGRKSLPMSWSDPSLSFSLRKKVPTDVLVRPKFLSSPQDEVKL